MKMSASFAYPLAAAMSRALCWIALAAAASVGTAQADDSSCRTFAPMRVVAGESRYSDKAGSVVDEQSTRRDLDEVKPLRDYVTYLVAGVDADSYDCVRANLGQWARAGALLDKPATFGGVRERLRFTTTLDLVALRMKAAGQALDEPTLRWLRDVNGRIADDFGRRKLYDNLRIWSGVAAATAAIVAPDARLQAYADDVWRHAMAAIGEDGAVATEVRRQSRALHYHAYYLSAVLFLKSMREASGIGVTAEETRAIGRLYSLIRKGTCDAKAFTSVTLLREAQIAPRDVDAATIETFAPGLASAEPFCGAKPASSYDPILGGDLHGTASAAASAARRPGP